MTGGTVIIGSRGSDLALYQARFIQRVLVEEHGCQVTIKIIKTQGDKIDNVSFDKMEGKGFFTKELEDALLGREIDLAVHSLKDLMTTQPDGLMLGAVGYRADRRELLLIRKEAREGSGVIPVRKGGIIGTSSNRRKCQVAFYNPSLKIEDLRGNVPTRVRKLREGQYDAILLAAAGVRRLDLDLSNLDVIELNPERFQPAPAQGILGMQIRSDDDHTARIVSRLNSDEDDKSARLERGLLKMFESGCSLPLGVYSEIKGEVYRLKAVLGVRGDDSWIGLKQADITGDDISETVNQAFAELRTGVVCGILE